MDLRRVAIIGPECTGKSDLSQYLAEHFKTAWVPEYARGYIDNLTRHYQQHDLLTIAHGQIRLEDESARDASHILICDTNLYVIKVWSEFKFGNCDPEILQTIATRRYDLYLLTYIDIPWEADSQREHPHHREKLFEIYRNEMIHQSVPCVEISGERDVRRRMAVEAIERILKVKTPS
ncbi:MAG: AAA family ATPase [Bacteroidota bacterium]